MVVLAGHADQEVGEVHAGFCSGEDKVAIELGDRMGVDFVRVKFTAKLDRVIAQHFGEDVGDLKGVVGLNELVCSSSGGEAVEVEVLDTLPLGIESDNAWRPVSIGKALRNQANVPTAYWLAEVGEVAQVAEVELIHCRCVKGL